MRGGVVWFLLLPLPAFALSDALGSVIAQLAPMAAYIAAMVFAYYVAIACIKALYINFFMPEGTDLGIAFDKFSPADESIKWDDFEINADGVKPASNHDSFGTIEESSDRFSDDLPEIDWHFDRA